MEKCSISVIPEGEGLAINGFGYINGTFERIAVHSDGSCFVRGDDDTWHEGGVDDETLADMASVLSAALNTLIGAILTRKAAAPAEPAPVVEAANAE